jgi:lantibiotic leader peptide-processing serine protease
MLIRRVFLSAALIAAVAACGADQQAGKTTASSDLTAGNGRLIVASSSGFSSDFGSQISALGGKVESLHAGAGIAVVSGADSAKVAALKGVSDVEADITISLEAPLAAVQAEAPADTASTTANPTTASRYSWQWNMRDISADKAWAAGQLGNAGVTAAILDTGIDYDAPDLVGLVDLSRSASFIPADDAITAKYFPTRNVISDYHGHGTNVATQISSNAHALAGVTSKTTLIGVKVLDAHGSGDLSAILSGVLWAADHGADVANMSLGGGFAKAGNGRYVGLINKTFNYARAHGMLVVVAAGNDSSDLDHDGNTHADFCGNPGVMCVAAEGLQTWDGTPDVPSFFTNFGRSAISVAGPGGNAQLDAQGNPVASAWPWGTDIASWVWSYCSKTRLAFDASGNPAFAGCQAGNRLTGYIGTSQATPHVAGLAALLVSVQGHGHPAQIANAIQQSADDLGQNGADPYYGKGRINVARALGL